MPRNRTEIAVRRGQRIRELRVRAKLTLPEAARRAKMSMGQLSEIETGKRWYERWQSLERLAGALRVTASELVDTADTVPAQSWDEPPPNPARRKSRRKLAHVLE